MFTNQRLTSIIRHLSISHRSAAKLFSSHPTAGAPASAKPLLINKHSNGCLSIKLDRPKALNALNLDMVSGMYDALHSTRNSLVLVYGEGDKAFCAGGDIRALAFPSHPAQPHAFFMKEYQLNHTIATYSKPYIAIMKGITMGGGVGISVHGKYRIICENTKFAMPETGIGLYPDVGGSYFLPRLPGAIGMYLALTGQQLGAADSMYAGIGTHYVPLAHVASLIHTLENANLQGGVDALLKQFATTPDSTHAFLPQRRKLIDQVFTAESYQQVIEQLKQAIATENEENRTWLQSVLTQLSSKSPTSLLITFEAMHRGATQSLFDCLLMELRLSTRITREQRDFSEGVKAIVVDKNHKPQWMNMPTQQHVRDTYFQPFTQEEGFKEFTINSS